MHRSAAMPAWGRRGRAVLAGLAILTVSCTSDRTAADAGNDADLPDAADVVGDLRADAVADACAPVACAASPCEQVEQTAPAPVLAADGSLATIAWARRPLFQYDPQRIPADLAEQVKNWDFYSVQSPAYYLEVTIAELSLFSFAGIVLLDYATGEKTEGWDLGDHAPVHLPNSPYEEAGWTNGGNTIAVTFDGDQRVLTFVVPGKMGGVDMSGEIRFADGPDSQSLAVVHPLTEAGSFFYEDQIFGMPTSGHVKAGDLEVTFDPQTAFGTLDWGRGIWPKEVQWFWGAGWGRVGGHDIAFNMGAGEDPTPEAGADGILVDGVIQKIGSFGMTPWDMDPDDPMKPWGIHSPDGRMDLVLTPHTYVPTQLELGDYYMHGIKVYGTFAGTLVLDDCTELAIQDFAGFAERSTQRW